VISLLYPKLTRSLNHQANLFVRPNVYSYNIMMLIHSLNSSVIIKTILHLHIKHNIIYGNVSGRCCTPVVNDT